MNFLKGNIKLWRTGIYLKLSKFKGLEVELTTSSWNYFNIGLQVWYKQKGKSDHHGLEVEIGLGWIDLRAALYDKRHTDAFIDIR